MKLEYKKKINELFIISKKKISGILNGILEKNDILKIFVFLNKKKITLGKISDCIDESKRCIFLIKDKKLIPAFYKKISLNSSYKVKRRKDGLSVSLDKIGFNNFEKRKNIKKVTEEFKINCNLLINEYKKKMPLKINKENEKNIEELRKFSKEKFLFLIKIIA
ncbi:hypothetical protein VFPYRCLA_099 [Candidatus Vidania fulgoroideae]|nr:hypothetical protein VFPYRCLA_099 [Candidatus Vidania fulgoroideae]